MREPVIYSANFMHCIYTGYCESWILFKFNYEMLIKFLVMYIYICQYTYNIMMYINRVCNCGNGIAYITILVNIYYFSVSVHQKISLQDIVSKYHAVSKFCSHHFSVRIFIYKRFFTDDRNEF